MWGVPKEHAPIIIGGRGTCIGAKAMCAFMGGQGTHYLNVMCWLKIFMCYTMGMHPVKNNDVVIIWKCILHSRFQKVLMRTDQTIEQSKREPSNATAFSHY